MRRAEHDIQVVHGGLREQQPRGDLCGSACLLDHNLSFHLTALVVSLLLSLHQKNAIYSLECVRASVERHQLQSERLIMHCKAARSLCRRRRLWGLPCWNELLPMAACLVGGGIARTQFMDVVRGRLSLPQHNLN